MLIGLSIVRGSYSQGVPGVIKPLPDFRYDPDVPPGPTLRIYRTAELDETAGSHWRINGHPATIYIWTAEEWERLESRPVDAQRHPSGAWCVLRMD